MSRGKLRGLLRLFRFELPFTAGVCVILGEILALGALPPLREMSLGFLSVFFISASALILNDYFDIEHDRINAPQRPLPSGLVTERDVVVLSIAITILGFITAAIISFEVLAAVVIVWAVGFLYNWRFKNAGIIGNLMVCFSVGMTFIVGGVVVQRPFETIVWFFAIWVLLIDLGEEIAADAMDVEGDRHAGSRSLAVRFGRERALNFSAIIFLVVVAVSSVPFFLKWFELIYLLPVLLTDAVILYSVVKLRDERIADRRKYIRSIYLSGLVTLVLLITIRVIRA
ncbi:MAG: UbiA family prenyltransferase [Bacteroidota bacterium]